MFYRSSWLPSKIPFTFIMLPIFWVSLLLSPNLDQWNALIVLITVNGFLFAAVNGYVNISEQNNTHTLNITKWTFIRVISVLLFIAAVFIAAYKVGLLFGVFVLAYGLFVLAWLYLRSRSEAQNVFVRGTAALVQGAGAFFLYYIGLSKLSVSSLFKTHILLAALAVSVLMASLHFFYWETEKKNSRVNGSEDASIVFLSPLVLFGAEIFVLWYFNKYITHAYNVELTILAPIGLFVLFQNYYSEKEKKLVQWLNWAAIVSMNIFTFYVFGHHTNVFQLLQHL